MKQVVPILAWALWVALLGPTFRQNCWECLLVMFAAVALVPIGLRLLGKTAGELYAFTSVAFCAAYFFDGKWYLGLPYLGLALWLSLEKALELLKNRGFSLKSLLELFALGYWTTGAFFALCFLADYHPLGFDPVIVSLTAAHFHVAGFVLTVMTRCMQEVLHPRLARRLGLGALLGMPLVAGGIVASKLGYPSWLEQTAGLAFVCYAGVLVYAQVALAFSTLFHRHIRQLWMAAAGCLLIGLGLAALYALRFQWPIAWINIPNMKLWHGTLNTLGFAWLSLMAWEKVIARPGASV